MIRDRKAVGSGEVRRSMAATTLMYAAYSSGQSGTWTAGQLIRALQTDPTLTHIAQPFVRSGGHPCAKQLSQVISQWTAGCEQLERG